MKNFNYLDLSSILRVEDAVNKAICREGGFMAGRLCKLLIALLIGNNQRNVQIDIVRFIFHQSLAT